MNPTYILGSTHFAAIRIYSSSNNNGSSNRPPPPRNKLTTGLATLGAGGLMLWGKGKYILGALKLTKFASLGSMFLTVGAYTAFYGFPYAVGVTSLILIHESGHALTMKKLGIPFSPMVFIPFMGAAVAMRKRPKDAYEEALVAFGGPVLGSVGALGFAGAAHAMDSHLMFALADFGFMINLFNMIPLGMMDGGRICGAISPYAGLIGLGIGGTMAYNGMIDNPIFYLILLGGGYETFMRLYDPMHSPPNYYRITNGKRALITAGYFGLVGSLFGAMEWNRQYMVPPEVLQRQQQSTTYTRYYD
jgi:Zn-dependent protease